jgi:hypothetical protein
MDGLNVYDIMAGVFAGNLFSAAFIFAFSRSFREDEKSHSWPVLAGLTVPLAFFLLSMSLTG